MRLLVTVVALAALLAGCGGQPDVIEPEPGATASDATPTATPPPLAEQAKEDSQEGAVASAHHWVKLFNYASRTGDVDSLMEYSSKCVECRSYAERIAELSDDERPDDDPWAIEDASVVREAKSASVKFTISILDETTEAVAFELDGPAPYAIVDIYSVKNS